MPDLAPLYDVVCTAAYQRLAKKLAMASAGARFRIRFSCSTG
ncbi:hypothetical protein [Bradyrhizobium sp. WSM2793]|nr:hypothetical protein [Bradyrhizobium sp. WSM2793]